MLLFIKTFDLSEEKVSLYFNFQIIARKNYYICRTLYYDRIVLAYSFQNVFYDGFNLCISLG